MSMDTSQLPLPKHGRDPMFVNCKKCRHEWAPVLLPMEAGLLASVLRSSRCPSCGSTSKDHALGRIPRHTADGDYVAWLTNGDTGVSSLTIYGVMTGRPQQYVSVPWDPYDFGRCYRLLRLMPSWRGRLTEVADKYPEWRPLVEAWDELTALYENESPSGWAPRLYARMQTLTRAASAAGRW